METTLTEFDGDNLGGTDCCTYICTVQVQRDSSLRCRSYLCYLIRNRAVDALKRPVNCAQSTDTGSLVRRICAWSAISRLLGGPFVQIIKYDSEWNTCAPRFDSEVIWNATAMDDCNRYGCLGNREQGNSVVRPSTAKHKLFVYYSKLFQA